MTRARRKKRDPDDRVQKVFDVLKKHAVLVEGGGTLGDVCRDVLASLEPGSDEECVHEPWGDVCTHCGIDLPKLPPITARPASEWTEEDGDVLWWHFPIQEPPRVGSPLVIGWDDFSPGWYTHWTPLPECPNEPLPKGTDDDSDLLDYRGGKGGKKS